ncbi:MAG: hypothetical protein RSA70_04295 [Clostridia bacterium]
MINTFGKMKTNLALALGAQLVVLAVGVIKTFLVPHVMPVDDYAYWQQYVLYSGFVGIFALGFNDGVYLIYGGNDYRDLPFNRLRGAFRFYCAMLFLFATAIGVYAALQDGLRGFGFYFVAFDAFVLCISGLMTYVLQITDQFKWFSVCTVVDKLVFLAIAAVLASQSVSDFYPYIIADAASKVVALTLFVWRCREVVFGDVVCIRESWTEFSGDVKVGVNLMFANFAGMLVANLGRFIVEWFGALDGYAYYSFGISVTNLILTFVTAASSVLYPALKRLPSGNYGKYYARIDRAIFFLAAIGLLVYFPAYLGVEMFYAKYAPMLLYLNLLFVAAVYQAKLSLLVNTFYNALRLERRLLMINVQCVVCFCVIAFVSFSITHDVWWIAASTAITAAVRCIMSEVELRRKLNIEGLISTFPLALLVIAFFVTTYVLGFSSSVVTFVLCVIVITVVYCIVFKQKEKGNSK